MTHKVCHDVGQWISDNVSQQLERCVEQDCNWWCLCCNKWLCGLVWVIVTVVSWVVTTVCEIVADVVELIINVVKGLIDIVVGIFTLDWSRIVAGFGEIIGGALAFVIDVIPILIGGTLIWTFDDARKGWELRSFVRDLLSKKFMDTDPEGFMRMVDALGLDSGGFGLRLDAVALRSFIRSDFRSSDDGPPDLIGWIAANSLDLKALAGFNPPLWWSREWPELVGDSGSISAADLDDYVAKGGQGAGVKQFSLFAMSSGDFQSRLDCADLHSREIGLIFRWNVRDAMLERGEQVLVDPSVFGDVLVNSPFSRTNKVTDPVVAKAELAMPMVIGGFGFTDSTVMGISAHLQDATCIEADDTGSNAFPGDGITGTDMRYRKPDIAFKYSAIHELGHTFGLCHVNGLLRIMFTNAPGASKSIVSWSSVWQYVTHGLEATFVLEEGKMVWQYIVANMDSARLQVRAF